MKAWGMAQKKTRRTFRLDAEAADALAELSQFMRPSKMVAHLVKAAHRHYRREGRLGFPVDLGELLGRPRVKGGKVIHVPLRVFLAGDS